MTSRILWKDPFRIPGYHDDFLDRLISEHLLEETGESESESSVCGDRVGEELQIVFESLQPHSSLFDLSSEDRRSVLSLRSGGDLQSSIQEIEAVRILRIRLILHRIECSDTARIPGDEHEIVPVDLLRIFSDPLLRFTREVFIFSQGHPVLLFENLPRLLEFDARERERGWIKLYSVETFGFVGEFLGKGAHRVLNHPLLQIHDLIDM